MQKVSSNHKFFLEIQQILDHMKFKATSISDHAHQKIIEATFIFPELVLACKKSGYSICSFLKYNFGGMWPNWPHPFFIIQRYFDQLLIFRNSYQNENNQPILSICYGDIDDLKILQSDWLRAFRPISQEQELSQIWDLCTNTANNTDFNYRTNSVKINDQNYFWSIFPILGSKRVFPKNQAL